MQHTIFQLEPPAVRGVNRIPSEIFSRIARLTRGTKEIVLGEFGDTETWPWSLAHVCGTWRRIIFGDPCLWTAVTLRLTKWDDWRKLRFLMEICLQNSFPCALTLRIHLPTSEDAPAKLPLLGREVIDNLSEIISSNASRLVDLSVYGWPVEMVDILNVRKTAAISELTHLSLVSEGSQILSHTWILPDAPRLTCLHLDGVYLDPSALSWSRIKSLICSWFYSREVSRILPLATALEDLQISHAIYWSTHPIPPPTLMPSLKRLILREMQPWPIDMLHFPNLKVLKADLSHVDPYPETWIEKIRDGLDRSNAALERITIKGVAQTYSDFVTDLLKSQKSLRVIKLGVQDTGALSAFIDWLLELCTLSLETVHLVFDYVDGSADPELKDLLRRLKGLDDTHHMRETLFIMVKNISSQAAGELERDRNYVPIVRFKVKEPVDC